MRLRVAAVAAIVAMAIVGLGGLGAAGAVAPPPLPGETAAEVAAAPVFSVAEIDFTGPVCGPRDVPAKDVDFHVVFRHESGKATYKVLGFWDGDGLGGSLGSRFKVRFCPTLPGRWTLAEVDSNAAELKGQRQGGYVSASPSSYRGFWTVDPAGAGGRWYVRSDGSHPYITGNTHYSFLSGQTDMGRFEGSIAADIEANARHFAKLRFSLMGDRYVHPTEKPFFDNTGAPTDDGDHSHRPNPAWFRNRVDVAVRAAFDQDLIADLILAGPDTADSRAALGAGATANSPTPYLKYVAARYGSFPNVWMCLANEWNIKSPRYTAEQIRRAGKTLRQVLPYPTPVSVHSNTGPWPADLNTQPPWNDHVIIQHKLKKIARAADAVAEGYALGGACMPVVNDELAYEGAGDGFSTEDVVEGFLGAFLGGGYGSTGCKPSNKKGQYFWGRFNAKEHAAAVPLGWLRKTIAARITFWKMQPVDPKKSVFSNAPADCRAMEWAGNEYVLGTDAAHKGLVADLPPGTWEVRRFDVLEMAEHLSGDATGTFTFDAPASRAVLFHFKKIGAVPAKTAGE